MFHNSYSYFSAMNLSFNFFLKNCFHPEELFDFKKLCNKKIINGGKRDQTSSLASTDFFFSSHFFFFATLASTD